MSNGDCSQVSLSGHNNLLKRNSKLTESTERDEAGDHERGMSVELLDGVLVPAVTLAVVEGPEEDEDDAGDEEEAGQHDHQDVLAPAAARHGVLVVISLPATEGVRSFISSQLLPSIAVT